MILVLGGTAEARALAAALVADGQLVTSSLAGAVREPRLPEGEVRIGGFGGPAGLAAYLRESHVRAVVDATHPFAARISASAAEAAPAAGVPLLRLERPGWREREGDHWLRVGDLAHAGAAIGSLGARRAFITTGRGGLAAFAKLEVFCLIRTVECPVAPLPRDHVLIRDRGPYTLERELALFDEHRIDVLLTKDSGGSLTVAKLDAARRRGLPVIVVERPPRPSVPTVATVAEALRWALGAHAGA